MSEYILWNHRFSKIPPKNLIDFCPGRLYRLGIYSLSFGKNESPTGSINIRQLNMEQTQDANCILLFFHKIQPSPHLKNTSLQLSLQWSLVTSVFTPVLTYCNHANMITICLESSLQLLLWLSLQLSLQCHPKKFFFSIFPPNFTQIPL